MAHVIEATRSNGTELLTSLNFEVCQLIIVSGDTYIGLVDHKVTRFCGNRLQLRLSPMFLVREIEPGVFQKKMSFSDYSFEFEGCRPVHNESNQTRRVFLSNIGDKISFSSDEASMTMSKRLLADID